MSTKTTAFSLTPRCRRIPRQHDDDGRAASVVAARAAAADSSGHPVEPAQDQALAERPRRHVELVHVERPHRLGEHDGTGDDLERAVGGDAGQGGARVGGDPRRAAGSSRPAPSGGACCAPPSRRPPRSSRRVGRATGWSSTSPTTWSGDGRWPKSPTARGEHRRGVRAEGARPGRGWAGRRGGRPRSTGPRRGGASARHPEPRRRRCAISSEPPPMSKSRIRSADQPYQRRTARNVRRASSSPESTCSSTPVSRATRARTSSPFAASRMADVAKGRSSSMPASFAASAASPTAARMAATPSSLIAPSGSR